MRCSVILPTHNPDRERLRRTLAGLRAQTLPATDWETVVVDNASEPPLSAAAWGEVAPGSLRIVREPRRGLTHARIAGLAASRAPVLVFVDDDTVLDPDYLEIGVQFLEHHAEVGALGGRTVPEFSETPPAWLSEFHGLLALRDLGANVRIDRPPSAGTDPARSPYPAHAPIGAGLILRRSAGEDWLRSISATPLNRILADRTGAELSSGGDNDLVFSVYRSGHAVAYEPRLRLTHLIPGSRLAPQYLGRLNRGIQRSWVQVLARHQACPWPAVATWTVWPRQARAYLRTRAWVSPAHRIRWQGLCGRFEGQADLWRQKNGGDT
ncbi:MAG: glycosyltransferase family 2 protein [Opitutaceae bacterium]